MLRLAAVATLLVLLSGCHVTLEAGVDVNRDGTGMVRAGLGMDDEAVREVGDVATELRLDDLRQTGWSVTGPRKESDGLTWVRASRGFSDSEDASRLVAQLSGPEGPFRDFRLSRSRSLARTRTSFTGTLDLAAGLRGLGDPDLEARLGGDGAGLSLQSLQARFGPDLSEAVRARVAVRLPGSITSGSAERDGRRVVWEVAPGSSVAMKATARALNTPVLLVAGVAAGGVLGALFMTTLRRRGRRRFA